MPLNFPSLVSSTSSSLAVYPYEPNINIAGTWVPHASNPCLLSASTARDLSWTSLLLFHYLSSHLEVTHNCIVLEKSLTWLPPLGSHGLPSLVDPSTYVMPLLDTP